MKIHLIDGTYELFRMFYGAPSQRSADGTEVGAVRALLANLRALVRDDDVTHVACAFDTVIESFRNALFSGYKTGDGIDPSLHAQFPLAEEAVRSLGIVCWSMVEFEADDALATFAARHAHDDGVEQVLLCSPDKDLAQCVVGDRVVLQDRRRRTLLDETGVVEKFGVPPRLIPDYLALVGDAADGIPGIPRWGPKSAATLLAAHGGLDAIPNDPAAFAAPVRGATALADSLSRLRAEASLYRTLATLRTDVPLDETVDDLRYRGEDTERLRALQQRLSA